MVLGVKVFVIGRQGFAKVYLQPFLNLVFIVIVTQSVLDFFDDVDVELFEGGEFYLEIVGAGVIPRCFGEIGGEVGGGELVAVAGVYLVAHQAEHALCVTEQIAFHDDFLIGYQPAALVGVEVGAEFHPKFVGIIITITTFFIECGSVDVDASS